jgi:peroxiredoxin (alkyl hydroperoxide reductase subunit C)
MDGKDDMTCCDWYFCTKKIDKDDVLKAVLKK